jgi:HSP20 family molecular chaperone IbpA
MENKTEVDAKESTAIEPVKTTDKGTMSPTLVGAEKMFERFADITKEVAIKAFDFFRERGGELGREVEDWFRAENEILRPTPVEITESEASIFVKAAVPGFKAEDIEVSVDGDVLIVSGATQKNEEKPDENTVMREWTSNRFYRRLTLPSEVMAEGVTANLNNGMLELTLPKAVARKATKVAVKGA